MNVLGIDPGIGVTALAYLRGDNTLELCTIRLGAKMDPDERIFEVADKMCGFLRGKPLPDEVVIEGFAMYGLKGSVTNAFHMGRLIQAILFTLNACCLRAKTIPAREVRKYITGNPSAKSAQIREGLRLMGYEGGNDHTRDALALALYWRDTHA